MYEGPGDDFRVTRVAGTLWKEIQDISGLLESERANNYCYYSYYYSYYSYYC